MKNTFSKATRGILPATVALFLCSLPAFVTANYEPLAPLPGVSAPQGGDFVPYVEGLINLLIGVAAVLAVIFITLGGIQYLSSDAIGGKEEGKDKIRSSLYGLILALASWLILVTINPNLVLFQLDPEGVTGLSSPEEGEFQFCYEKRPFTEEDHCTSWGPQDDDGHNETLLDICQRTIQNWDSDDRARVWGHTECEEDQGWNVRGRVRYCFTGYLADQESASFECGEVSDSLEDARNSCLSERATDHSSTGDTGFTDWKGECRIQN